MKKNETSSAKISPSASGLSLGDIQFYDNYLPGLTDGKYKITVTPELNNIKDYNPQDLASSSSYFKVAGPRFSLPESDIHAKFPVPNSSGQYDTCLAHIVLTKRTLPWERSLGNVKDMPWLALLTVKMDELIIPSTADTQTTNRLTGSFACKVSTLKQESEDIQKPQLELDDTENDLTCQAIQLTAPQFLQLIPQWTELRYLSHCRQVNAADKEALGLKDEGWFSVVVGNRFPKAASGALAEATEAVSYSVHLVSLEGWDDILQNPSKLTKANVQLVSLASWSFHCLPEPKENFETLLTHVVQEQSSNVANALLRLPAINNEVTDEIATYTTQKLFEGYIPFLYHTRTAESSLAWYRGPLTPTAADYAAVLPANSKTGSNLIIYDKTYGIFDMTYATAWQLGKLLALSDAIFAQALMTFRRQQHTETLQQGRQSQLRTYFAQKPPNNQALDAHTATDHFLQSLQQGLVLPTRTPLNNPQPTSKSFQFFSEPQPLLRARLKTQQKQLTETIDTKTLNLADIPKNITDWLTNLLYLNNVPFAYLVSDERLLPPETIRFFYVDNSWLDQLLKGALSLGIHNSHDEKVNTLLMAAFKQATIRRPACGFLLRSNLVSGWPGLAVRVDEQIPDSTVTVLRQVRLAPTVLLCLFDGRPSQVVISEPQEQLSFGIDGDSIEKGFIAPRQIEGMDLGMPLAEEHHLQPLTQYLRSTDTQVLNLAAGKINIVSAIQHIWSHPFCKR